MKKIFFTSFIFLSLSSSVFAQDIAPDKVETVKATVLEVLNQELKTVPGTDIKDNYQTIKVQILEGSEKDKVVTVDNDYLSLKKGEVFYLMHTTGSYDGIDRYAVLEPYRLPSVMFFVALFIILVCIFGGIQGIRGLLSLLGSLLLIIYVLLPGILQGYSPILMSLGVSALIVTVGSYITHGFNKTTSSAVIGMIITILFSGVLAYIAVHVTRLSGFANEEATYLNLDTKGSIDFVGLLLGGILIGLLGVLYDVAINQAIAVEELHNVAPHLPHNTIYKRALRIGREHIGALVNTLAIAYVGVSLPLILYVRVYSDSVMLTLNKEIFSTEIIRIMIGSIGLVIAVPITTFIATWILVGRPKIKVSREEIETEKKSLEYFEHHH